MALTNLRFGRRTIASLAAASMITTGIVAVPEVAVTTAFASEKDDAAKAGTIQSRWPVVSDSIVWVEGSNFAPRKEGQGLAVDLFKIDDRGREVRVSLPKTVDDTWFTRMVDRGNGVFYGELLNLEYLPNEKNQGNFSFPVRLPDGSPDGEYIIYVKSGLLGENAPVFVKKMKFTVKQLGEVKAKAHFGRPDAPNIGASGQGQTVTGTFTGLPEGSKLLGVGVFTGDEKEVADEDNWAPTDRDYVADANGEMIVPGIQIPADAPLGERIGALFRLPNGEIAFASSKRPLITPVVETSNEDEIKVLAEKELPAGVYQSVYDPEEKVLYATVSNFTTSNSQILKIDPETLEYSTLVDLPAPGAAGEDNPEGVFGIGLDPVHKTLWTTNTIGQKATVYQLSDGAKVASLPLVNNNAAGENKVHPRSAVIDTKSGKAYVGDAAGPNGAIFVYDTNNLVDGAAPEKTITIPELGDRSLMELKLDEEKQELWSVSFDASKAVRIELANNDKVTLFDLGNSDVKEPRGGGVALDTKRGHLFVATQEPSQVKVLDIETGSVIQTIITGANPLDAIYDELNDVVYTINRTSGTVNLIDPETFAIKATRELVPFLNHLSTDGEGNIFVTSKPALGRYPVGSKYKADPLFKLTVKDGKKPPADDDKPGTNDPNKPGTNDPNKPGTNDPNKPGTDDPNKPGTDDPNKPGTDDPNKPGTDEPGTQTPGDNPSSTNDGGSSNNTITSSANQGGNSTSSTGVVGIAALIAAILAALGFAYQSGMLPPLPPLPGMPQR